MTKIPRPLWASAGSRLVSDSVGDKAEAGRRFVRAASSHGIDLNLLYGTLDPNGSRVREVCLGVISPGRTAMLFVSEPKSVLDSPLWTREHAERVAAIHATCDALKRSGHVRVAQCLCTADDVSGSRALLDAGFHYVGDLAYLRRPLAISSPRRTEPAWPAGISVIRCDALSSLERDERLVAALDATYHQTLDCPELCGVRETRDVLESHRSSGAFDPKLWWVVEANGVPEGCMLFNRFPDRRAVELVYLGLSPALRGKRLGAELLNLGLANLQSPEAMEVTCAVDRRNRPALGLYASAGFVEFSGRVAYVRAL